MAGDAPTGIRVQSRNVDLGFLASRDHGRGQAEPENEGGGEERAGEWVA